MIITAYLCEGRKSGWWHGIVCISDRSVGGRGAHFLFMIQINISGQRYIIRYKLGSLVASVFGLFQVATTEKTDCRQ